MDFGDGSRAIINPDFSVTYTDKNETLTIAGFPSKKEAQIFCDFADFYPEDNDYVLITKPAFALGWSYS